MTKPKLFVVVAVVFSLGLIFVEVALLKGKQVASKSISLSNPEALLFNVSKPGKDLLIEIETKRGYGKKKKGRALRYRLLGPDDVVIEEDSEVVARKKRYIRFTADAPGEYALEVEPNRGSSTGSARTRVYLNDKRITPRLGM